MPLEKSGGAVAVALYVRTPEGDPDNSLPVQFDTLQEYARRQSLDPVRVYFDIQGGGSQLEAMMAEATGENPPFRQVLVYDEGRLCGGEADLRARLEGHGVAVMAVTEPPEGGSQAGMLPRPGPVEGKDETGSTGRNALPPGGMPPPDACEGPAGCRDSTRATAE